MLPGPTIIKKCAVCFKLIEQDTIGSGNTFGATFWTDGKHECPMLPYQHKLVMCPHCHSALWIDELEELGQIDSFNMDAPSKSEPLGDESGEFKDAREYKIPSTDDYFALLENGIAGHEKERYVRLHAWWAGNDERRIPISLEQVDDLGIVSKITGLFKARQTQTLIEDHEIPLSLRETANLNAFAQSLDESDDDDLVMKAEVMRELGRFDEALSLLSKATDKKMARAVETIKNLSERRDPYVQKIEV